METLPPATTLNSKWYELWMDVWFHPGEEAFRDILKERDHSPTRGFIWVAISSLVIAIVSTIGYVPLFNNISSQFGNAQNIGIFTAGTIVTYGICSIILIPISAIIGLAILAGIYHLLSKLFRGTGEYGNLVFCMAAVTAPASIIGGLISLPLLLFTNFPAIWWLVAIFFGILSVVFTIYTIVMYVNAIRAAEAIGTWQAVLTYFLPPIIIGVLSLCCVSLTIPSLIRSTQ